MLELNRLTCLDGTLPGLDHTRDVVRMDGVAGRPLLQFLGGLSEVLQGLAVDDLDLASGTMGRNKSRNAVEDQAQALLTRLEGLLSALSVINVSQHHVPARHPAFRVSRGESARLEPAVNPIGTPLAQLERIRLPGFDRAGPGVDHARKVIRMEGVPGGPTLQVLAGLAEIFQSLPVEMLDLACRTQGTDEPGNGVDDQTQIAFGRSEGFLCALSVFDVGVRSEPFDNPSIMVERWSRTEQKPAIHAIEAAQAPFDLTWLARSQHGSPVIQQPFQIVRVQGNRPAPITR